MRSPIIAFSLFAAVSPALVSAAPQSPRFNNDEVTHPRNTEVKVPERFAFPRADSLPFLADLADTSKSQPPKSNEGHKPNDTPQSVQAAKEAGSQGNGLPLLNPANQGNQNSAANTDSGRTPEKPRLPEQPNRETRPPNDTPRPPNDTPRPPNDTPRTPKTGMGAQD